MQEIGAFDAKTHFAMRMVARDTDVLYLDPLSLRDGAFDSLSVSDVIVSRWSKQKLCR